MYTIISLNNRASLNASSVRFDMCVMYSLNADKEVRPVSQACRTYLQSRVEDIAFE